MFIFIRYYLFSLFIDTMSNDLSYNYKTFYIHVLLELYLLNPQHMVRPRTTRLYKLNYSSILSNMFRTPIKQYFSRILSKSLKNSNKFLSFPPRLRSCHFLIGNPYTILSFFGIWFINFSNRRIRFQS